MKNIDDFDGVMSSWKSFEFTNGSLEQIQDCHNICDKIIENYNRYISEQNKRKTTTATTATPKGLKRKFDTETSDHTTEKKKQKSNETISKNPFVAKKVVEQKKPDAKTNIPDRESNEKDNVTVFLSNLSYEVTENQVLTTFPDLNIKNVDLIVAASGKGRGYGYLELSSPAEVEKALTFDRRPINDRPVFITKVLRDRTDRSTFKYSDGKDRARIFIKGLAFDTTKVELQDVFGKFGKINDIRLVTRK